VSALKIKRLDSVPRETFPQPLRGTESSLLIFRALTMSTPCCAAGKR